MKHTALTNLDKLRLKDDIRTSLVMALLFTAVIAIVVLAIPAVLFFTGKLAAPHTIGTIIVSSFLLIPFIVVFFSSILKILDLKSEQKERITTTDFKIIKRKENRFISIKEPKLLIQIDDHLSDLIEVSQPLTIEITKLSKTLLYISQDSLNLLDKFGYYKMQPTTFDIPTGRIIPPVKQKQTSSKVFSISAKRI